MASDGGGASDSGDDDDDGGGCDAAGTPRSKKALAQSASEEGDGAAPPGGGGAGATRSRSQSGGGFGELLGVWRHAFSVTACLAWLAFLTGGINVNIFAPVVFAKAGLERDAAAGATVVLGVVKATKPNARRRTVVGICVRDARVGAPS